MAEEKRKSYGVGELNDGTLDIIEDVDAFRAQRDADEASPPGEIGDLDDLDYYLDPNLGKKAAKEPDKGKESSKDRARDSKPKPRIVIHNHLPKAR